MQPDERNDADPVFRRYLERPRRRSLAKVVDAWYRFVWDTALRVTGNAADAADITQDVFLKLLLRPPRPDQVSSPHGFLAWEVVGRATSLRRAAERRKAREQAAVSRAGEGGLVAPHSLASADLDELRARVRELPEDLRNFRRSRRSGSSIREQRPRSSSPSHVRAMDSSGSSPASPMARSRSAWTPDRRSAKPGSTRPPARGASRKSRFVSNAGWTESLSNNPGWLRPAAAAPGFVARSVST